MVLFVTVSKCWLFTKSKSIQYLQSQKLKRKEKWSSWSGILLHLSQQATAVAVSATKTKGSHSQVNLSTPLFFFLLDRNKTALYAHYQVKITNKTKPKSKKQTSYSSKDPPKNKPKPKQLTENYILRSHSQSVIVPASLIIKKEKYFFLLYCKIVQYPTSSPCNKKRLLNWTSNLLVSYVLYFKITLNMLIRFIWHQESLSSERNEA